MTDQEYKEFKLFGCASRCIIKAAEMLKRPISREDFLARFSQHFPEDHFGLLTTDKFCLIVTDLNLCYSVHTIRDSGPVIDAITARQPVFVLTDFKLDHALSVNGRHYHCRLAVGVAPSPVRSFPLFQLWEPNEDDTDALNWVALDRLEREFVHYLIFGAKKGSTPSVLVEPASTPA